MKVQNCRAATELLKAGGVLCGSQITMPDGVVHECWNQVPISLGKRNVLTRNPRGQGWIYKQTEAA